MIYVWLYVGVIVFGVCVNVCGYYDFFLLCVMFSEREFRFTPESFRDWFSVYQHPFLPYFSVDMQKKSQIGNKKMVCGIVNGSESEENRRYK
jgi:hypothetical protein